MQRTANSVTIIVVLALAVAAVVSGCGLQDKAVEKTTGQIDVAKDAAVKAQLMMVKTGIQAHIASSGTLPADASRGHAWGGSSSRGRRTPSPMRR